MQRKEKITYIAKIRFLFVQIPPSLLQVNIVPPLNLLTPLDRVPLVITAQTELPDLIHRMTVLEEIVHPALTVQKVAEHQYPVLLDISAMSLKILT